MQEMCLREHDAQYRRRRKRLTGISDPIYRWGKAVDKEKDGFLLLFFIVTVVFYKYG